MQTILLVDRVNELIQRSTLSVRAIAKCCGVPYQWILLVRSGKIPDPGFERLQKIYEFLSGEPLIGKSHEEN